MVRFQLFEAIEQSLERVAQERVTDNDIWVVSLYRRKERVE
jgi:hypothetical protein